LNIRNRQLGQREAQSNWHADRSTKSWRGAIVWTRKLLLLVFQGIRRTIFDGADR
jgi:hypothetical protein